MKREEAIGEAIDRANEAARHRGPSRARKAMLAQPLTVGPITIDTLNLLTHLCLEEIGHPMLVPDSPDAPKVRPRDVLNMLYIFANPDDAYEIIGGVADQPEALAAISRASAAWARSIPAHLIPELQAAVRRAYSAGQPPGADLSAPQPAPSESEGADPLP
jgi:hypothetical protein